MDSEKLYKLNMRELSELMRAKEKNDLKRMFSLHVTYFYLRTIANQRVYRQLNAGDE